MFSMTDGLPDRESVGVDAQVGEDCWPQVSAALSDLDAGVRSLTDLGRVSEAEVRHARRESRRVLREHREVLGLCESCRREPAVRRVVFADLIVFAVCAGCAGGAVAGVAA